MSERVSDASVWIDANGANDAETVELIQSALIAPGDWGSFVVRREGTGMAIVGPVSTLVLADEADVLAFQLELEERVDDEAAIGRPAATKRQPR
ncbi:hypothetical protein [Methylobacterium sp. AMS5]|uniref:hypothetical protein n=1 Tax=Methylobacterium sp. AMS5 TaxID=925818 RepID=UPI00074F82D9|nr:hypothetical protein [Methylobacterium sp. AMS5]AMB48413.1 hypothetical protein Y590_25915 [Methylobacterium sp. AMS5]